MSVCSLHRQHNPGALRLIIIQLSASTSFDLRERHLFGRLSFRLGLVGDVQPKAEMVEPGANDGADVRCDEATEQPVQMTVRTPHLRSVADHVGEEAGGQIARRIQGRATVETEGSDQAGEQNEQADRNDRLRGVDVPVIDNAHDAQLQQGDAHNLIDNRTAQGQKVGRVRGENACGCVCLEEGRPMATVELSDGTVMVEVGDGRGQEAADVLSGKVMRHLPQREMANCPKT